MGEKPCLALLFVWHTLPTNSCRAQGTVGGVAPFFILVPRGLHRFKDAPYWRLLIDYYRVNGRRTHYSVPIFGDDLICQRLWPGGPCSPDLLIALEQDGCLVTPTPQNHLFQKIESDIETFMGSRIVFSYLFIHSYPCK